jgi:tetratricopeptide (TPR) repeat protein
MVQNYYILWDRTMMQWDSHWRTINIDKGKIDAWYDFYTRRCTNLAWNLEATLQWGSTTTYFNTSCMKSIVIITLSIFCLSNLTWAQPDKKEASMIDGALLGPKLIAAKHEFNENNMRGALTLYREVLDVEPNNYAALYGTAQCHYYLKKYNLALEYLDKAVAIRPNESAETQFFYGQTYHRTGKLDEAIASFQKFTAFQKKTSYEVELALQFIQECKYAKAMMTNPAPVQVINMGDVVNSRFDDYTPSISSDNKTLLFTSRRNTNGNRIDEKGDYKYFEDIFSSEYDESTGTWSKARAVEGQLNTDTYDAVLSVSPDGNSMFVYKNNTGNAGDIYYSTRNVESGEWGAAEKLERPINSSYFESSVTITADGNILFFISERPEGLGQGDIYMSEKKNGRWSNPKNLGEIINTESDEKFVFIHPNGKTLYFASNGHRTMGSYDIFKSEWVNGEWSLPVNLGYPINTVNEESTFSLSADNSRMYLSAELNDSFGERDIYVLDVSQYDLVAKGYDKLSAGQLVCTVRDGKNNTVRGVELQLCDENGQLISIFSTNKEGVCKITTEGNRNYIVKAVNDKLEMVEYKVNLQLKATGETIIPVEIKI